MKIIGIDDAGRGPVLGPMILSGIITDEEEEKKIKDLGAKDSKLLTPKQRKILADYLRQNYTYHLEKVEPKEIDEFPNLNNLEAIKAGIIINKLMSNLNEKVKVFVDCPSVNTKAWSEYLKNTLIKKDLIELHCEHKADFKYPIVSAASIISKETREDELKKLKGKLNINFGSGYPADPVTKDFLVKTFGEEKYDSLIRKSWKTYKNLQDKMDQRKLFYL
ncbi:MAG: ribonuclease HII [Candidatus Pacearchaeota archaeon]